MSSLSWTVYRNGAPDATAVPAIVDYKTRGGLERSRPLLISLGAGAWAVDPTLEDRAAGVVLLVDNGVGVDNRYVGKAIHNEDNPFVAWWIENGASVLFSGVGSPAFTLYDNARTGAAVTPQPSITPVVAPYLWQFTPTLANLTSGIGFQIANPAGAAPSYHSGDVEALDGAVLAAAVDSGCTVEQILDEARTRIAATATSRDRTRKYTAHKTGQAFADSPISKGEGFEVVARNPVLTEAFGRFDVREGEFRMVVRIGQTPGSGDDTRENFMQSDIARLADILEAHTWRAGVQGVWYEGADINKDNPNWWMAEIVFRVVHYGKNRT